MIQTSNFVKQVQQKPVAVFGLGVSNLAVIRALVASDIAVTAWDDREESRLKAQALGATLLPLTTQELSRHYCLVLAPGVPLHFPDPHEVVCNAREAGIEIICDMEILHRCQHGRKVVGITGTNGKSTTTALIGHILTENNIAAAVGGNIGKAVFDLDFPPEGGVFVLEMSSYQIDLCPSFKPDIAVLLNITPDHIDRHGTMENYVLSKASLFDDGGHGTQTHGVIGVDDAYSKEIAENVASAGIRHVQQISWQDNVVADLDVLSLQGDHNKQNMAAAYQVCRLLGTDEAGIFRAMKSFPGLAHRQYPVRTIGPVRYINDSKATNAEAAAKALSCFDDIYWIVGGLAKDGGLSGLEAYKGKIKGAFVIGEDMKMAQTWLSAQDISFELCKTLAQAVDQAHHRAQGSGYGTVLLSPACASFDQYSSFEKRGEAFAALVSNL